MKTNLLYSILALVTTCCFAADPPAQSEPVKNGDPVVGRWLWENSKQEFFLEPDGTAKQAGRSGKWVCLKARVKNRKYEITWDNGVFVDTLTLALDSIELKGKNQKGDPLRATHLPLVVATAEKRTGVVEESITGAPVGEHDMVKAMERAKREHKLTFVMMGRKTCSFTNHTRKLINEGKSVRSDRFVMADLDCDTPAVHAAFFKRFHTETFGKMLPYVVILDAQGNVVTSWSGGKKPDKFEKLVEEAKKKAVSQ